MVGIGHDAALGIDRNASSGDVQEVRVRDAADSQQQDLTRYLLRPAVHTEVQSNRIGLLPHALHLGFQEHGEAARIDVREALADLSSSRCRSRSPRLIIVISVPRAPKKWPNSAPMYPPPRIAMRCGCRGSRMMVSEVW